MNIVRILLAMGAARIAAAAWAGYMRLPKFGLHRILEALARPDPE